MPGLVHVTVAGIQNWITGGFTELKQVRGGSALLTVAFGATEDVVAKMGDEVVSSSSGSLSVYSSSDDLESVGMTLVRELRVRIPDLPAMYTVEPDGEGRQAPVKLSLRGYPPGTAVCAFSGEAAATGKLMLDNRGVPRSDSIDLRNKAIEGKSFGDDVSFEMSKIGAATLGRFAGYVGVVVADGDGVGSQVQDAWKAGENRNESVRTLNKRLKKQSEALIDAAYKAGATDEFPWNPVLLPTKSQDENGAESLINGYKWNPVITGGDDITLVVPAASAPATALGLSSQPEAEDDGGSMAASVAVFLCKSTYPFHLAWTAAEDLLKEAKRRGRLTDSPTIHLRFEMGSIRAGQRWGFPGGPYTRAEFEATCKWAAAPSIGNTKLRHLASAIAQGGRTAQREWLILTADIEEKEDPTGLRALFADESHEPPFFADRVSSPIGDLIDLVALLGGRS